MASAGEFGAALDGVVSPVTGAAPAGVLTAGGLAVGLPAAGAGEAGSLAGGFAAGVAVALVLPEGAGALKLGSGVSELCVAAAGLFLLELIHPNP